MGQALFIFGVNYMKMYVKIENGAISSLQPLPDEDDIYNYFDPSQVWIDVTSVVPQPEYGWTYDGFVFAPPHIGPTFPEAVATKIEELRNACAEATVRSSFPSPALGSIHNYDCRVIDQVNLQLRYSIVLNTAGEEPLWASDGTRFTWINHSAAELLEVMVDMNEHIKESQVNLASKLAAVDAATTIEQVNLIHW